MQVARCHRSIRKAVPLLSQDRADQIGEIWESETTLEKVSSVEELIQICPNESRRVGCDLCNFLLTARDIRATTAVERVENINQGSFSFPNFIHPTSTNQLKWLLTAAMTWTVTISKEEFQITMNMLHENIKCCSEITLHRASVMTLGWELQCSALVNPR